MRSLQCDVSFADYHDDDRITTILCMYIHGVKGGSPNELVSQPRSDNPNTLFFSLFNEPQKAHKEPNGISQSNWLTTTEVCEVKKRKNK